MIIRPPLLRSRPTPILASLALLLIAPGRLSAANPQLAAAASPFLRANADTAIDWMPWGDAAFARAKEEQKPVYLVIGSVENELGRAMARQSFSNAEVAAFVNANFVPVIVDANERPDLAALYQVYLQTTKQLSGLPMDIWLTPELKPFEGTTYLPPTDEWGKEGFFVAMRRIAAAWKADANAQRRKADAAVATVIAAERSATPPPVTPAEISSLLATARETVRGTFDAAHGGFGEPPKHPEPELIRFLLRDPATRDMALKTLGAIVDGALHDPIDGGFFRYVMDAEWRQPYLQKTLDDQARLALALLDAAQTDHDPRFAAAAAAALSYALDRLHDPVRGFAAAEDATAGNLANSYFWTSDEIAGVLGSDAPAFDQAYGITAAGNIPVDAYTGVTAPGKNLPYRAAPAGDPAQEKTLAADCAQLLARRARRPAPALDPAAPAGAHGLILAALARAGDQLKDARFTAAATAEFAFIREHLLTADHALRRLPDQPAAATPRDYALVIVGLRTLAATGSRDASALALELTKSLNALYWDATSGRYYSSVATAAPGFWARVHSPAPEAGDPPSAAAALLTDDAAALPTDFAAMLTRALAAGLKDSPDNPPGGVLLTLQPAAAVR